MTADSAIDDVRIVSDDLYSMTTFAYNQANEQTKRRAFETESAYTDMDITYDDWGRTVTRQMAGPIAVV